MQGQNQDNIPVNQQEPYPQGDRNYCSHIFGSLKQPENKGYDQSLIVSASLKADRCTLISRDSLPQLLSLFYCLDMIV